MAEMISDYEKKRKKNIEDNALALMNISSSMENDFLDKNISPILIRKRPYQSRASTLVVQQRTIMTRSHSKPKNKEVKSTDESKTPIPVVWPKLNFFGEINGYPVGSLFATRMECCRAGVHRSAIAGIHGSKEGCYSVAISGGYEDDEDNGFSFTYTGSGGRDLRGTKAKPKNLRTAPQSSDQELTGMNLALSLNCKNGQPVRVIRSYKLKNPYAPKDGYRYDGLYNVEKFYPATGSSGYRVWKYFFRRLQNQAPAPWEFYEKEIDGTKEENSTKILQDKSFCGEDISPELVVTPTLEVDIKCPTEIINMDFKSNKKEADEKAENFENILQDIVLSSEDSTKVKTNMPELGITPSLEVDRECSMEMLEIECKSNEQIVNETSSSDIKEEGDEVDNQEVKLGSYPATSDDQEMQ